MTRQRSIGALLIAVTLICAAHGIAAATPEGSASVEWTFEAFTDPVNRGGKVASARVVQPASADGSVPGTVDAWVRCWTATGLLDARFELSGLRTQLLGDVVWHFDRRRDQHARWRVSPSGHSVVVPDTAQRELLRSMRTARELHLKLVDVNGTELPVTVSLRGSSRAIGDVADACRVR